MSELRPSTGTAARAPTSHGAVLTFDAEHADRPHHRAEGPAAILDILAAESVRAIFFVQGRWAAANPRLARRIAADGHAVGSHSNSHLPMTRLSDDGIAAEVLEAQERIHQVTGADPRPYFRCPYGDGHEDPRVREALGRLGYRLVGWDINPTDWEPARSSGDIASHVTGELARQWDSPPTILLHTWPATTPEALQQILHAQRRTRSTWLGIENVVPTETPGSTRTRRRDGANRP